MAGDRIGPGRDDGEGTVLRPRPAGVRVAPLAAGMRAAPGAAGELEAGEGAVVAGEGPLAVAAAPLLQLLARLRNAAGSPDPGAMREKTRRELRAFERRATAVGVAPEPLRAAHYALCAALDDAVLNTPWGGQGRWRDDPLTRALHDDADPGQGFFDQLRTLRDGLPATRPVMALMFLCLSLGMMGRYRGAPDGAAQLERVRRHVHALIAGAAPADDGALSASAGGVRVPAPPRGGVPVWVAAAAVLAALAGAHVWALVGLNAASDAVYDAATGAAPSAMPGLARPPATPPPSMVPAVPAPAAQLRAALTGLPDLEIVASPAETVLRVPGRALFPQPNATLGGSATLDAIAAALRAQNGPVHVVAYSDGQPRSVGFPSGYALSAARARAVRAALVKGVADAGRYTAEGRGDAEPLVPGSTPENRERNRRIEIVVTVPP